MQLLSFFQNVLSNKDANSTEFDSSSDQPVIDLMEDQKKISNKGRYNAIRALMTVKS